MKKTHINIFIHDTDQYFALGLAALVQSACLRRRTTVTFLTQKTYYLADLMIVSGEPPPIIWPYHARAGNTWQVVLLIQDRVRYRAPPSALHEVGVIKRSDSTNIVLQLIDLVLKKNDDHTTNNAPYYIPTLTARELQVLSGIAQGLQSVQIAKQLGLHAKTISSHKCAAMRKLGFSRNQELYYWLRRQSELMQNNINSQGFPSITVTTPFLGKYLNLAASPMTLHIAAINRI